MRVKSKKTIIFSILALLIIFLPISYTNIVNGQSVDQQIDQINKELNDLEKNSNKLNNEIESYQDEINGQNLNAGQLLEKINKSDKEIKNLESSVEELQKSIDKLLLSIKSQKSEIELTVKTIESLEIQSKIRIQDNYVSFRTNGSAEVSENNIFSTEDVNDYFKDTHYIEIIQKDSLIIHTDLSSLKLELEKQQKKLEESLATVKNKKESLEKETEVLAQNKAKLQVEFDSYVAAINSLAYQQYLLDLEKQNIQQQIGSKENHKEELIGELTPISSGEYVEEGTLIGYQGCTGIYCTGAHVHLRVSDNGVIQDPCSFLDSGIMSDCGWGNRIRWPLQGNFIITSTFGNRCYELNGATECDFHDALDISSLDNTQAPVYASHSGYMSKGVDSYGSLFVKICEAQSCNQGLASLYLHFSNFR